MAQQNIDFGSFPDDPDADTGCAHTCKMTYHGICSLQECTRLTNRQEEAAPEPTVRTWTLADHPISGIRRFNLRT